MKKKIMSYEEQIRQLEHELYRAEYAVHAVLTTTPDCVERFRDDRFYVTLKLYHSTRTFGGVVVILYKSAGSYISNVKYLDELQPAGEDHSIRANKIRRLLETRRALLEKEKV